jgi:hemerythrin-like metal-binding protein
MSKITWNDSFSVKNDEIDNQHKKWIEMINDLHDVLIQDNFDNLQKITVQTLDAMNEYVRYHFSAEEKYMQKIGYPGLPSHKTLHEQFYLRITTLHSDIQAGKLVLNTEIMKTLTHWLQEHILNEDMKYSRFAAAL